MDFIAVKRKSFLHIFSDLPINTKFPEGILVATKFEYDLHDRCSQ